MHRRILLPLCLTLALALAPSLAGASPRSIKSYTAARKMSVSQVKRAITEIATGHIKLRQFPRYHCSRAEVAALMWIAQRESSFNPCNVNHSSGCSGLFQLSPGMIRHHAPWFDPFWNTARNIKYCRGRFGGILQAKRFWISHGWF